MRLETPSTFGVPRSTGPKSNGTALQELPVLSRRTGRKSKRYVLDRDADYLNPRRKVNASMSHHIGSRSRFELAAVAVESHAGLRGPHGSARNLKHDTNHTITITWHAHDSCQTWESCKVSILPEHSMLFAQVLLLFGLLSVIVYPHDNQPASHRHPNPLLFMLFCSSTMKAKPIASGVRTQLRQLWTKIDTIIVS